MQSMAKALVCAMPRSLDGVCKALNLKDGKDKRGEALIKSLCIPIATGKRKGEFNWSLWEWLELIAYCQQDVIAEEGVSNALPSLTPREQKIWELDRDINLRGVKLDISMAKKCIGLAEANKTDLNEQFCEITGVERATMRAKAKAWMSEQLGFEVPDTKADTLQKIRATIDNEKVKKAITLMVAANQTSIGKYTTMLEQADPYDERVRGLLIYHGATTGRWTASGVQLHNLPKGKIEDLDMDSACVDIMQKELDALELLYGSPMTLLSAAIRGTLMAREGKMLLAADYNAIEARSLFWLAKDAAALNIFQSGVSIYIDMASELYGRQIDKKKDPSEYNFGKVAVLGLGYGMGYIAFFNHCRSNNITFSKKMCRRIMGADDYEFWTGWVLSKIKDDDIVNRIDEKPKDVIHELALMKYVVGVYRNRYPSVTNFWDALETAAIKAVKHTTKIFKVGNIAFRMQDKWLCCRLPSGRLLRYFDPKLKKVTTPWGEKKIAVHYMAVRKVWRQVSTYGGKIAENVTQGVARDVLCDALIRLDEALFWLILHVHDEGISEVDEAEAGQLMALCVKLMEQSEEWCKTLPVAVEAEIYKRYRK